VFDRYVPDFQAEGFPAARVVLAHPYLEDLHTMRESWREDPACVVLWEWPETLFALFVQNSAADAVDAARQSMSDSRRRFSLAAGLNSSGFPVFFDYEGVWSRVTGVGATLEYPRAPFIRNVERLPVTHGRTANLELLAEVCRGAEEAPPRTQGLRHGSFLVPRRERRAIRAGLVERRVFLNLSAGLLTRAGLAESVVFIRGRLAQKALPQALLHRLSRMRILPFLYATDRQKVFFATLTSRRAFRNPPSERPAVLRNLQQFLTSIEMTRGPLVSLNRLVDQRYHPLFEPKSASSITAGAMSLRDQENVHP
jgi:hypothetical protein